MNVLEQRLQHRQGDISDATADLLTDQQATWQDFTASEQQFVINIDTQKDDWQAALRQSLNV